MSFADLSSTTIASARLENANLANANLTAANLFGSSLSRAVLANASFEGAEVSQAFLIGTTSLGFTSAQLYSTASYRTKNLERVRFNENDLTGWDFQNQNLAQASFSSTTLANADFQGAVITGARFLNTTDNGFSKEQLYSTASYKTRTLQGIGLQANSLNGWDFSNQNLTDAQLGMLVDANLSGANLTGVEFTLSLANANFSDAVVRGAWFRQRPTEEQLYSTASCKSADLHGVRLEKLPLASWNFAGQDLTNASFIESTLTSTDFSGSSIAGASFEKTTAKGFTKEQLYSTASHIAGNLQGVSFRYDDVSGWDFSGQDLTDAKFFRATLIGTDFEGATVTGTAFTGETGLTKEQLYSTASYKSKTLHRIQFDYSSTYAWNFANQDLTDASFFDCAVRNADFSNATVTKASFARSPGYSSDYSLTAEQLYSTASYQVRNLDGIGLSRLHLQGWDFRDQSLVNASLYFALLDDADLSNAHLANALLESATLNRTNLTRADLRGAKYTNLSGAVIQNTIHKDGNVYAIELEQGDTFKVRDHDGDGALIPPLPISVFGSMTIAEGATMRFEFEADPWDSLISFEANIPLQLGGTLELTFTPDVDVLSQVGRTIRVFDWTGVEPTGAFTVASAYPWDLSELYTTGEITFLLPGSTRIGPARIEAS